ncbi:MFS transporter, OCT family, solute carrier family 22 (organic cation transporter), member 4/5 [Mytilus galloprovincialis]|uniref:MFS transporter, OCT family, solute carrier family 22 (Organic cation transporter), member 4/5 n=1 Tax=Mytilus galloprovincialis TaxID=29158 RepID=A0A8B6FYJ2_MYTGA|nr:MFS transporter, OCT family, solute carrier family 22 (organic cation transporter), member 4/5 [Mytilus galloprovincialis]
MSAVELSFFLEETLVKCGGFGVFQLLVVGSLCLGEISTAWSILMMTFGGAIPNWSCEWGNQTSNIVHINGTQEQTCTPPSNYSDLSCLRKVFDPSLNTIVSEFSLVCDLDYITQTITTIQMGGLLVGSLAAGQFGDRFGRKPTYFLSLLVLLVSNLIAAFSINWQMFAVMRFFIGCGCGIYLTVHLTYKIEFVSGKYRPMLLAVPIWSIFAASYGGVSYLIHDWFYLHIATAAVTFPQLFTWWLIPESFRWLVANDQVVKAEEVIRKIAKFNGNPFPDTSRLKMIVKSLPQDNNNYTYFDVLKNPDLLKKSILLAVGWISCGYTYYAISFGVQQLSGSLYLNMFLLSIVEVPSLLLAWFFNHCIGRKWTTFMFFLFVAATGTTVGIVQIIATQYKFGLINGFALASKLGVGAGWACLMLLTTESYPTVVRNIGYGIQNTVARIGAMVAPQIVYVSQSTTGVMYFLCGGLMLLSAVCVACVPDTKERVLSDTMETNKQKHAVNGKNNEAFQKTSYL